MEVFYGTCRRTNGKTKTNKRLLLGIASALIVIAILCVAVIAVSLNKKHKNDNIDEYVLNIINEIMAAPEYVSSIASLGVYGDFNDDGVKELLLTYEVNSPDTGYCVIYSLMRIDADGGEIIRQDTLYEEVGGNSGYCGVTEYNGTKYFTLVEKIPNGQGYIEYMTLFPWDASGEKLINDGGYYLECAVNIDEGRENGIFIWGDQKISMEEYDAKKNEISWIHKMDPAMGPDPGYTASFDELLTIGSY